MNFVPAVAYPFCLDLPVAFTQPGAHLSDQPCTCLEDLLVRGFHSGLSLGRPHEGEQPLLRLQRERIELSVLVDQPGRREQALDEGRVDVALVLIMRKNYEFAKNLPNTGMD